MTPDEKWEAQMRVEREADERQRLAGPKGDGCLPRLLVYLALFFAGFVGMVWLALKVLGHE